MRKFKLFYRLAWASEEVEIEAKTEQEARKKLAETQPNAVIYDVELSEK